MHLRFRNRSRTVAIALSVSLALHLALLPLLRLHARGVTADAHVIIDSASPHRRLYIVTPPSPKPSPTPKPLATPKPLHAVSAARQTRPVSHTIARRAAVAAAPHLPHAHGDARTRGISSVSGTAGSAVDAGISPLQSDSPEAAPATATEPPPTQKPSCSQLDAEARTLQVVTPELPQLAAAQGASGSVAVRVSLSETGRVLDVGVAQSSGSTSLDAAALDAARRSTYAAAVAECHPYAGVYLFRVDFPP